MTLAALMGVRSFGESKAFNYGYQSRYPKFKSKQDKHKSYTTNFTNGNIAVYVVHGKIKLPKLKEVKVKVHREFEGQIKSTIVSQVASGKY